MKFCTCCQLNKDLSSFSSDNRRNKIGYKSWCKECCKDYHSLPENKIRHKQRNKNTRIRYKREWTEFFISIYGNEPKCEICSKTLRWNSTEDNLVPNFDHRHNGTELISSAPAGFWGTRACTEQNKDIWIGCDFGILCSYCNLFLPTKNREQWLENVIIYVEKSKTSFVN